MKTAERQSKMSAYLSSRGYASLNDIVAHFGVSISTVRRDLEEMQRRGVVKRTHGGAFHVEAREHPLDYASRQSKHIVQKEAIAALAASMIEDGDAVLLDAGTTTFRVAKHLVGRPIHVVTNSLPVATLLSRNNEAEVVLLGGAIIPGTGETIGRWTHDMLGSLHAKRAVIGVAGITADGLFNANLLMAELQRLMTEVSDELIVVVDHSKFGRRSLVRLCELEKVNHLITDSGISDEWREIIARHRVKLHIADDSVVQEESTGRDEPMPGRSEAPSMYSTGE